MDISKTTIIILIRVLFASIFLIIFFFKYLKKIEEAIIINHINFTIDSVLDGILPFIPPKNKKAIYNYINSLELTIDKNVDIPSINSNKKLLQKSIDAIIRLTIVIIVIIAVIYLFNKENLNPYLPQIATENLIIAFFIALTIYTFLNSFATKFILINPNQIKYNLLNFNNMKD
jgi:hypothetical protein